MVRGLILRMNCTFGTKVELTGAAGSSAAESCSGAGD